MSSQDAASSLNASDSNHYYLRAPDERQDKIDRLIIQAQLFSHNMRGQYVVAPIDFSKPGLKILDPATPNGIALRDIKQFLKAPYELQGAYSTSEFFPTEKDPSIEFVVQQTTKPWPAQFHSRFDLIIQRMELGSSVGISPREVVHQLCGLLAPGGWIQLCEMNLQRCDGGPALQNHTALISALFAGAGVGNTFSKEMEGWLTDAGLVDVEVKSAKLKLGKSIEDDELLARNSAKLSGWATGSVAAACRAMGLKSVTAEQTSEEWEKRLEDELMEQGGANYVIFAIGRKPDA